MNSHPSALMLKVWATCVLLYVILPFQALGRNLTVYGYGVLGLFLLAFCVGVAMVPAQPHVVDQPWTYVPDFARADKLLKAVGVFTMVCLAFEFRERNLFDLTDAYKLRSDQGTAILTGDESPSSIFFQLGFLSYPASYVYIARSILFERERNVWKLVVYGILPVLVATLAMGGRSPFFYALVIAALASTAKHELWGRAPAKRGRGIVINARFFVVLGFIALSIAALYYFIAVFFTRAEGSGGASGMFDVAEGSWGIGFGGEGSKFWFELLGDEVMYLIFVFTWYLIQGLLMCNIIFTSYEGPMQLGIYGIDLGSAIARRINPQLVASGFDDLVQLNTYGFLPSAFGSLYVDFKWLAVPITFAWGYIAGMVYQRIRARRDARWLLVGPFITWGILFSSINTPLGASNGLVMWCWLAATLYLSASPDQNAVETRATAAAVIRRRRRHA